MRTHEVISAFLDDEPFDSEDLVSALSDPTGRALLIDLVELRRLCSTHRPRPAYRAGEFSAAARLAGRRNGRRVFVALAGGYLVGERRSVDGSSEAPPPTRIVHAVPFVPTGGIR